MTSTESVIVEKYTAEINSAAAEARTALVNELHLFLGAIERRLALTTKLESAARSFVGEVEGEVKALGQSVIDHVEGLVS